MSVEPYRLHSPDEDEQDAMEMEQEADRVSIRYVLKQNRDHILDRFHRELKLARLEPDGETLALKDFFRLPLSAGDEKWIQFQIEAINDHLLIDQDSVGDGSRPYEAVRSPRSEGGGIDLLVRPRAAATRSAAEAKPGWRDRIFPFIKRFGPVIFAASAVFFPMLVPRVRNIFLRYMRLRRLGQEEPNITSEDLQEVFAFEPTLSAASIGQILRSVHRLASKRKTSLVVNEPIPLEKRDSALYPCYADSHGRVSMLDNAGYHLARNLERGELIFVEQKRNSSIVDEIYLSDGFRLAENEDWYDFNRIAKPVLDKRPVFLSASTDFLAAVAALMAFNVSLQLSGGWNAQTIALAGVAAALMLFSGGMFVARTRRRMAIRAQLMQSYMEYRASLPGDEYTRLVADAHGAAIELEGIQVFLLQPLRPGQEFFVQRNDRSEIVNIFDLDGQHLHFFDGGRRFYMDIEEIDTPALLAPWFTGAASIAGLLVTGTLMGQQAPLPALVGFFVSLGALLVSAAFLVYSIRRRTGRRAVMEYIIHRLKRNDGDSVAQGGTMRAERNRPRSDDRGVEPAFSAADRNGPRQG